MATAGHQTGLEIKSVSKSSISAHACYSSRLFGKRLIEALQSDLGNGANRIGESILTPLDLKMLEESPIPKKKVHCRPAAPAMHHIEQIKAFGGGARENGQYASSQSCEHLWELGASPNNARFFPQ